MPSGTLWATCNIGAGKPEDHGDYFAWGETKTKSVYDPTTYKYNNEGYDKLTKYCNKSSCGDNGFTDNLTDLQTSDDPATSNWGKVWRTPSEDQWDELLAYTTSQWTIRNGVNGRLFTSKKNGQTLFLPAAGYRWVSGHDAGSVGYYWSRSFCTDDPYDAWYLDFGSDDCGVYIDTRHAGFSVRPVRQN